MCQAAAEACVGLCEHLCPLEAFGLADDDVTNVRGDDRGLALAADVVIAAGLKRFHEGALTAVAESDDGEIRVFRIRLDDVCDFESAHIAHVCRADDGCGRVVFQRRQRECGLRAGLNLKAFSFQGVAETLGEIDVAVDQQNFGYARCAAHESASCRSSSEAARRRGAGFGPGVSALRFSTSMTSPSCESQPATCGKSASLAGIISA